jgi:hypothetical protein
VPSERRSLVTWRTHAGLAPANLFANAGEGSIWL